MTLSDRLRRFAANYHQQQMFLDAAARLEYLEAQHARLRRIEDAAIQACSVGLSGQTRETLKDLRAALKGEPE